MESNDKDKMSDSEKLVNDHRQMLLLSGNLSDFQLENLKKWPFVVFGTDLKQAEIHYDFKLEEAQEEDMAGISAGSVHFKFTFNKQPDKELADKGLSMLKIWTKFLFWQDTVVTFAGIDNASEQSDERAE